MGQGTIGARAAAAAGTAALRVLGRTWRTQEIGLARAHAAGERGRGLIFASWHRLLLAPIFLARNRGHTALISRHRDGEIVAGAAERLGFRTVRGSSTRGGPEALEELAAVLRAGGEVVLTPDGPKGPPFVAKPGAVTLAIKTGAPIIPCACLSDRAWTFRSWDRFQVPKPFARVVLAYGAPLRVVGPASRANVERTSRALGAALFRAADEARAALGSAPAGEWDGRRE